MTKQQSHTRNRYTAERTERSPLETIRRNSVQQKIITLMINDHITYDLYNNEKTINEFLQIVDVYDLDETPSIAKNIREHISKYYDTLPIKTSDYYEIAEDIRSLAIALPSVSLNESLLSTHRLLSLKIDINPDDHTKIDKKDLACVAFNPFHIIHVANPSEELQLAVVKADPFAISVIANPTRAVQASVFDLYPDYINFVRRPEEEFFKEALYKGVDITIDSCIDADAFLHVLAVVDDNFGTYSGRLLVTHTEDTGTIIHAGCKSYNSVNVFADALENQMFNNPDAFVDEYGDIMAAVYKAAEQIGGSFHKN